ncbi:MAG: CBS domain-containing protein [Acidimicrobiia bacterium]|nr:CBS domain-containing protein [Acidimicrobiia bacterium]
MRVIDLMTTDVVTIRPEQTIKEAARLMVANRVSGLPVVDDNAALIGIVTEADFLERELDKEAPSGGLLGAVFGAELSHSEAVTVGEVMSTNVVTVAPDATLAEAARVLATNGVKRLPIVDAEGLVIGVISRADIVAAFARPDELIDDEIREDISRRILFIDPDALAMTVKDGIVEMAGELPTKTDARILEELTRRLEGVVRVDSSLTWKVDDTKLPA